MEKERFVETGRSSFFGDYLYDLIVPSRACVNSASRFISRFLPPPQSLPLLTDTIHIKDGRPPLKRGPEPPLPVVASVVEVIGLVSIILISLRGIGHSQTYEVSESIVAMGGIVATGGILGWR